MDIFGKGELTLKVRVMASVSEAALNHGALKYDRTAEYLSPDNWLDAETWQDLPENALVFEGIDPTHHVRVQLIAEERDPHTSDSLGMLVWDVARPCGDFESNPTTGGKKGQHVKVRGTFR